MSEAEKDTREVSLVEESRLLEAEAALAGALDLIENLGLGTPFNSEARRDVEAILRKHGRLGG